MRMYDLILKKKQGGELSTDEIRYMIEGFTEVSERGLLHMGNAKERIESGKAVLGIEFGSTRIKAVLVDETHQPIASGAHDWENQLVDGIWTYSLDMIWDGLRDCYRKSFSGVAPIIICVLCPAGTNLELFFRPVLVTI